MLCDEHKAQLHQVARESIKHGLQTGDALDIDTAKYDDAVTVKRATFVTLHKNHQLRGCIGILEPLRPLVEDVAHNAYAAAFSDSRFPPLATDEFDELDIHISILGTPEPVQFDSEADLIRQLCPGVDGLILEYGHHRSTFLPSVWTSIDNSREFLMYLKQKAGLAKDFWSDSIKIQRYRVEEF